MEVKMAIEVVSCVIERHDGPTFCGLLFYEHGRTERHVPWSVDLTNPRQVLLKLFPSDAKTDFAIVREHYERMADVIVDTVMAER